MRRYQRLSDLFVVTCRACGSTDVDLEVDVCDQCGNSVNATCNGCGARYCYHDFIKDNNQ